MGKVYYQNGPLNGSNQNKRKPGQYEPCLNIYHIMINVQKYRDKNTYLLKSYLTFSFWILINRYLGKQ